MRGDQISRQWRILRHLEASRTGLTAAEITEIGGSTDFFRVLIYFFLELSDLIIQNTVCTLQNPNLHCYIPRFREGITANCC
jgi:hypothetical protein